MSGKLTEPNHATKIRFAAAVLIAVVTLVLEWYFVFVNHNEKIDQFILLVAILVLVVLDPVIVMLVDKHPEQVLEKLKDLRTQIDRNVTAQSVGAKVLQVGEWDSTYLKRQFIGAKPGEVVKIWTTFFDNETAMHELVTALVGRGVVVHVLLMNHKNPQLVNFRFRLRKDRTTALGKIDAAFNTLSAIQSEFGAELLVVKSCDTMPFGTFFQIGRQYMLLGFFLPHLTWENGPLVRFERDSVQWEIFEEAWGRCWKNPCD